jgi:hypothetical protein
MNIRVPLSEVEPLPEVGENPLMNAIFGDNEHFADAVFSEVASAEYPDGLG